MLFNIPDLDLPLEVKEPICCKLCINYIAHLDSSAVNALVSRCQFCMKMKQCVEALNKLKINKLFLGDSRHVARNKGKENNVHAKGNILLRESA